MLLQFNIENQHLERLDDNIIASDSKDYLEAEFTFSEDWDGLTKTALFRKNGHSYGVILENDKCIVPWEAIKPGTTYVSVFGGELITTDIVELHIEHSGYTDPEETQPPTPTVYEQILEILSQMNGGTTSQYLVKKSDNDFDFKWKTGAGEGEAITWGDIGGELSDQADLQKELDKKLNISDVKTFDDLIYVEDYLYNTTYDSLDYKFAYDYMKNNKPIPNIGACSSVRNGNWYGRNFDWTYDESPDFIIKTPHTADRFATVGVANISKMTDEFVKSGEQSEYYRIAPFLLVDGINEYGVVANINVVPQDKGITYGTTPAIELKNELCSLMIVRFVLDHFKTAEEAVNYLRDYTSIYVPQQLIDMNYEAHFMIADPEETYVVEFVDNEISIVRSNYMTNFHLTGVTYDSNGKVVINRDGSNRNRSNITLNGSGLERFNLIVENYSSANSKNGMRNLMNQLTYTNSYNPEYENFWYTEFVGVDGLNVTSPTYQFFSVIQSEAEKFNNRSRNPESEYYGTWQTTHSSVYDIENRKLYLIVQEGNNETTYSIDVPYYRKDEVDEQSNNLKEWVEEQGYALARDIPTKLSELDDDTNHRTVTDTEKQTWNTKSDFSGNYNDLTNKPTIPSVEGLASQSWVESQGYGKASDIPTNTSELENDSGYITNSVNNLINYYVKNQIYTKNEVNNLISAIAQIHFQIANQLPTHDIDLHTIYFVPKQESTTNSYNEYVYINNKWELIGSTDVDLSNYYTKQEVDLLLSGKVSQVAVNPILHSGTKIAEITVNGNTQNLYAPTGGGGGGSVEWGNIGGNIEDQEDLQNALNEINENDIHVESGKIKTVENIDISGYYSWTGEIREGVLMPIFTNTDKPDLNSHIFATGQGKYLDLGSVIYDTDNLTYIDINNSTSESPLIIRFTRDESYDDLTEIKTSNKFLSLNLTNNEEVNVNIDELPTKNNPRFTGNFAMNYDGFSELGECSFAEGKYLAYSDSDFDNYDGESYKITYESETNDTVTFTTNMPQDLYPNYMLDIIVVGIDDEWYHFYPISFENDKITAPKIEELEDYTSIINVSIVFYELSIIYSNVAEGYCSHAEGGNTISYGEASHAEGCNTKAFEDYSHAEGYGTLAFESSHAEGYNTVASGYDTHSEGYGTLAFGRASHAEGSGDVYEADYLNKTISYIEEDDYTVTFVTSLEQLNETEKLCEIDIVFNNMYCYFKVLDFNDEYITVFKIPEIKDYSIIDNQEIDYAEYYIPTLANGEASHAEGLITTSSGDYSHSEGKKTIADGESSHAEGDNTISYGEASHAEGCNTTSSGDYSHSEGKKTSADGNHSHAEGFTTNAFGESSHSEGEETIAEGEASHAEGKYTIASGKESHAEGFITNAFGNDSHSEGKYTIANGEESHVEGFITNAFGTGSHSEGVKTFASRKASHAEGNYTIASGEASHAEGKGDSYQIYCDGATITYSEEIGNFVSFETTFNNIFGILDRINIVVNGYDLDFHVVNFDDGFITVYKDESYNIDYSEINEQEITYAYIFIPTEAKGDYSHAEGFATITYGEASHAEGYHSIAMDFGSHAEGNYSIADNYSHSEGVTTRASFASHSEGGYTRASGEYSHAEGYGSITYGDYSHAEGGGEPVYVDYSDITITYFSSDEEYIKFYISLSDTSYDGQIIAIGFTINNEPYEFPVEYNGFGQVHIRKTPLFDYINYEDIVDQSINYLLISNPTIARGKYSHAEGCNTYAISDYSHTEGHNTSAEGYCSHAEGYDTHTYRNYSHAEGYKTIAHSNNQHAEGKYNIEDTQNEYAHIVGNGTSDISRSNAHTLDWEGNAWFAGDVEDGNGNKLSNLNGCKIVPISQAAYDALVTKDSNTLYIVGD